MIGEWEDWEVREDGSRILLDRGRNLVVASAAIAIALAMKPLGTPANAGFLYWAVGDGNVTGIETAAASLAWDAAVNAGTTKAASTDTRLLRETYRKAIQPADVVFVDANNNVVTTPTNRLRITSLFLETEPSSSVSFYFREWGLFGGTLNADGTGGSPTALNTGILINRKVHTTYVKQTTSRLQRVLYFTF